MPGRGGGGCMYAGERGTGGVNSGALARVSARNEFPVSLFA